MILTEQDIINTYNKKQQEQCKLYYRYLEAKEQNPKYGHKRLARKLKTNHLKLRWWYFKNPPVPMQTINWLKEKGLIPLKENDKKLSLIAKILGTTFGDGGIDINHNMIFLSSSELNALEDFKQDLVKIFGKIIEKNFDMRIGGINKTSQCQRNTNRKVIRFFKALGAPIGNKTKQEIFIPEWIKINNKVEDQFYFSLFGSEAGIPRCREGQANSFDIAIGGLPEFHENRLMFMNKIKSYLINKNINFGKVSINKSKTGLNQHTYIYRLLMSTKIENMISFLEKIKLNYCYYKTNKLKNTIDEILIIKNRDLKI